MMTAAPMQEMVDEVMAGIARYLEATTAYWPELLLLIQGKSPGQVPFILTKS